MTKERFRELVKRLHPDAGGSSKFAHALRAVLNCRRLQRQRHFKQFNKCWCGVTINPSAKHCGLHMRKQPIAAIYDQRTSSA